MKIETKQVELRIITAKEGYTLVRKDDTEFASTSKLIYLGKEASPDDWIEVDDKVIEEKAASVKEADIEDKIVEEE